MSFQQISKLIVALSICFVAVGVAQQDPHYTQYMYNTMSVNPAYAGSKGHPVITALGRTQWVGLEGAPDTQTLSFDTPIGYSGVGLGLNIVNDKIGPSRETYIDVNATYTIETGESGKLAFGMKLGGRQLSIDWSKGIRRDGNDVSFRNNINKFLPTVGAGIYYYTDSWYVGGSVPNFIRTEHYDDKIKGGDVATERFHMFAILGFVFDLSDDLKFKPATILKAVQGAPVSLDISANFLFSERFRAGLAWRWDDSLSTLLGFNVNKKFMIGFAYDLTTSNIINYNSGTYELMLRYEFMSENRLKSPRFF